MKGDRLSVFIEANRFLPAVNQHRYSFLRAEADAVAERMLIIANNSKLSRASRLYGAPSINRSSDISVYELEANELSAGDQSPRLQSTEPPVLPRISVLSAFNPFDESVSSPSSTLPDLLKPAVETGSLIATASATSEPPTDYLPFIAPTAPFDPFKEQFKDHPAGPYGAQRFKNKQTISSAPFRFESPTTPSFANEDLASFPQFSDASLSVSSDVVAEQPFACQSSCSPPRAPPSRPSKISRKPLPPGAQPFPPVYYTPPGSPARLLTSFVSYTPPGSPLHHAPLQDNTSTKIVSSAPKCSGRALLETTPIRSPPPKRKVRRKPGPNLHKPLPPIPIPASSLRSCDCDMQLSPSRSPNIIPRPVTAADRVRSDLRNVKDRFPNRLFKLSRF